jgi:valyl-tRNA synthetase
VDIEKEKERLTKEVARLEGEVKRVDGMLNNERFISKAPQAKIDEEKEKKVKYTQMLEQVKERLSALS